MEPLRDFRVYVLLSVAIPRQRKLAMAKTGSLCIVPREPVEDVRVQVAKLGVVLVPLTLGIVLMCVVIFLLKVR